MKGAWRKLLEKASKDRGLAAELMGESAEKVRHWVNVALASIGIYLALVAIDVRHYVLDALLVAVLAVCVWRAAAWNTVLKRLEHIVSGDPPVALWDTLREWEDFAAYMAVLASFLAAALLLRLGLIP